MLSGNKWQQNLYNMIIKCNVHIETLTQITKEQAEKVVSGFDEAGVTSYLEPSVSGEVKIDYPLENPDFIYLADENSVGGILWEIAKRYKEIYKGEEKTSNSAPVKSEGSGLLNRGKTDGNYGIYGHDLFDLWFEMLVIEGGIIGLHVGS